MRTAQEDALVNRIHLQSEHHSLSPAAKIRGEIPIQIWNDGNGGVLLSHHDSASRESCSGAFPFRS